MILGLLGFENQELSWADLSIFFVFLSNVLCPNHEGGSERALYNLNFNAVRLRPIGHPARRNAEMRRESRLESRVTRLSSLCHHQLASWDRRRPPTLFLLMHPRSVRTSSWALSFGLCTLSFMLPEPYSQMSFGLSSGKVGRLASQIINRRRQRPTGCLTRKL
jgi:hypothetical protein